LLLLASPAFAEKYDNDNDEDAAVGGAVDLGTPGRNSLPSRLERIEHDTATRAVDPEEEAEPPDQYDTESTDVSGGTLDEESVRKPPLAPPDDGVDVDDDTETDQALRIGADDAGIDGQSDDEHLQSPQDILQQLDSETQDALTDAARRGRASG